ncbi:uncharacterized protein BCR38DRAFT_515109 [Pseudomassariella vexata]|uniref:Uncharacterized protein n=1 Tax=Pseudomassariella vexata TaxID=1141098 RepID=A0A1Y2DY47_9PEZI|nr:uncharacterized protein BCR38DRAFT_515109 [Pseudomassariella vexata]ORY64230.1 hypothetical protein BCR38DRAFT_515109 [Pseudomassariella vexata]
MARLSHSTHNSTSAGSMPPLCPADNTTSTGAMNATHSQPKDKGKGEAVVTPKNEDKGNAGATPHAPGSSSLSSISTPDASFEGLEWFNAGNDFPADDNPTRPNQAAAAPRAPSLSMSTCSSSSSDSKEGGAPIDAGHDFHVGDSNQDMNEATDHDSDADDSDDDDPAGDSLLSKVAPFMRLDPPRTIFNSLDQFLQEKGVTDESDRCYVTGAQFGIGLGVMEMRKVLVEELERAGTIFGLPVPLDHPGQTRAQQRRAIEKGDKSRGLQAAQYAGRKYIEFTLNTRETHGLKRKVDPRDAPANVPAKAPVNANRSVNPHLSSPNTPFVNLRDLSIHGPAYRTLQQDSSHKSMTFDHTFATANDGKCKGWLSGMNDNTTVSGRDANFRPTPPQPFRLGAPAGPRATQTRGYSPTAPTPSQPAVNLAIGRGQMMSPTAFTLPGPRGAQPGTPTPTTSGLGSQSGLRRNRPSPLRLEPQTGQTLTRPSPLRLEAQVDRLQAQSSSNSPPALQNNGLGLHGMTTRSQHSTTSMRLSTRNYPAHTTYRPIDLSHLHNPFFVLVFV